MSTAHLRHSDNHNSRAIGSALVCTPISGMGFNYLCSAATSQSYNKAAKHNLTCTTIICQTAANPAKPLLDVSLFSATAQTFMQQRNMQHISSIATLALSCI